MVILFTILKILGILLCVILILLLLVLFAPIVYVADGDSQGKKAHVKVRWLFGLLRFWLTYEGDTQYGVRVLCFSVWPRKQKEVEKVKEKKETPQIEEKSKKQPVQKKEDKSKKKMVKKKETSKRKEKKQCKFLKRKSRKEISEEKKENRVLGILQHINDTELIGQLFPKVQQLLFHIAPRKLSGDVVFGMDDPATTGMICGMASMMPFVLGSDLVLNPDFETSETYIYGNVKVKGQIQVIFLLLFGISFIQNKDARKLIRLAQGK